MKWEKLFAPHILARGHEYFCNNTVKHMEVSEDFVRASVLGTEEYEVEISLINAEVSDMYCS